MRLMRHIERVSSRMFARLLLFGLVGCVRLFAALRPEEWTRYFLAEWQRRALSANTKVRFICGMGGRLFLHRHFHRVPVSPQMAGCCPSLGTVAIPRLCRRVSMVGYFASARPGIILCAFHRILASTSPVGM